MHIGFVNSEVAPCPKEFWEKKNLALIGVNLAQCNEAKLMNKIITGHEFKCNTHGNKCVITYVKFGEQIKEMSNSKLYNKQIERC